MKSALTIGLALALCLAAGAGLAAEKTRVKYSLDWVITGRHAPWFTALDKGFYDEQGLSVEISRGYGAFEGLNRIVSGESHFNFADTSSLVVGRSRGMKVKTVAVIYGRAPYAIYTLKKSNLTKPKDLEGKVIGAPAGDSIKAVFPAFAKRNGIDESKVRWLNIEATAKTPMLLAGQVDAVTYYNMQTPLLERDAARLGGVNVLLFADFGLQLYSNGIAVMDDLIKRNPDMIRRFVAASVKGFRYAFEHPDEAVELLVKRHPIVNRGLAKAELDIVKDLVLSEEARQHGIGYISRERMQLTRDVIAQAYNVKTEIPLEDLYTNDFLPR